MELPFNTVYSKDILGNQIETPVADWPTKRAWVDYAFDELPAAGYTVSSAYTMVKDPSKVNFSYRDNLWHGSDLLATGMASFGHVSGVHYQNQPEWDRLRRPSRSRASCRLGRGMRPTPHQLLVREMILQLKTGCLDVGLLPRQVRRRHPRPVARRVAAACRRRNADVRRDRIKLTRKGLLRADALLPAFFEPEHQGVRYT